MDKYEYKVRAEEIKALIAKKKYAEAAKVADSIDWTRVRSVIMLCTVSDLYKINRRLQESRDILLLAYERNPNGRTIVYSLCELSIKLGDVVQAIEYYKMYVQLAPKDTGRYILQYKLYEAQEVSLEERIAVLEEFKKRDYREKWAYELAYLYHRVGLATRCVEECDDLILWFGEGKYVMKAMELKMLHEQLTAVQQKKYNKMKGIAGPEEEPDRQASQYGEGYGTEYGYGNQGGFPAGESAEAAYPPETPYAEPDEMQIAEPDLDIQVKPMRMGQYDTINLQKELAENMKELMMQEEVKSAEKSRDAMEELSYPEEPYEGRPGALFEEEPEPAGMTQEIIENIKRGREEAYVSEEGAYVPAEVLYAPEEGNYTSAEELYVPEEGAYGPEGVAYAPSGEAYIPEEVAYAPSEETYAPEEGIYAPSGETYGPEEVAYAPSEETYAPEEGIYAPPGEAYGPGDAVYAPGEGAYAPADREAMTDAAAASGQEGEPQAEEIFFEDHTSEMPGQEELDPIIARMLSQEYDGQISLVVPDAEAIEKQITGQLSIEDVLAEWERMKKENEQKRAEQVRKRVLEQTGAMFSEFDESARNGILEQLEEAARRQEEKEEGEERASYDGEEEDIEEEILEEESSREQPDEYVEEIQEDEYTDIPAEPDEEDYGQEEEFYGETDIELEEEADIEEEAGEFPEEEADIEEEADEFPEEEADIEEEADEFPEEEADIEEEAGVFPEQEADITADVADILQEAKDTAGEGGSVPEEETAGTDGTETQEEEAAPGPAEEAGQKRGLLKGKPKKDKDAPEKKLREHRSVPEAEEGSPDEAVLDDEGHEVPKSRSLTEEEMEVFGGYIQTKKEKSQIVHALDTMTLAPYTGNVLITGDTGVDKVGLAKELIKEIKQSDSNFSGKVAKITGKALNQKDVEKTFGRISNGALIIERAGELKPETLAAMNKTLEKDNGGIIILMEDNKKAIDQMLDSYEAIKSNFNARIDIEALSNDALVAYGKKYAAELEYSIDDLGMLALYTRVADMQTSEHDVTAAEVRDIIDEAINSANRKNLGHFKDLLLAKRYDEEDMIVLREKDFLAF